jgi:hypothetical protein
VSLEHLILVDSGLGCERWHCVVLLLRLALTWRRTGDVVLVGVCAGWRRVVSIFPLAGENAEKEDDEAAVESPAGDGA